MTLKPDQILENRYEIIEKLGEGGMGEVWKALDTKHDDEVVIKMPLNHLNNEILKRFGHEAKTMRRHSLDCPHILNIEDIGMLGEVPWYIMRFLPGGSARSQMIGRGKAGDIQWENESFDWLKQIASALDYLHKRETYHRDVKPENILFSGEGTPYLVDFGIVKNATETTTMITEQGKAIGTMAYMAPEILDGGNCTPQSDQYALAVTLYEVITGDRPFSGTTYFALFKAIQQGHQTLKERFPAIPQESSDALDRALSVQPEPRFDSCAAFANQFINGLKPRDDRPVVDVPISVKPPDVNAPKVNLRMEKGETTEVPVLFSPPNPKEPVATALPKLSKHHHWWMLGLLAVLLAGTTLLTMFYPLLYGSLVGQVCLLAAWFWVSPLTRKASLPIVAFVILALSFVFVQIYQGPQLLNPFSGPVGKSHYLLFYSLVGILGFIGMSFALWSICKIANTSTHWGSLGLQTVLIGIGVIALFLLAGLGNRMNVLDASLLINISPIPLSILFVSASLPLLTCAAKFKQTLVTLVVVLLTGTVAFSSALELSPQFADIGFMPLTMRCLSGIVGMAFTLVFGFSVMRALGYRLESFNRWVSLDFQTSEPPTRSAVTSLLGLYFMIGFVFILFDMSLPFLRGFE